MEHKEFRYYAFISYSHKDQKIAMKLQKRLEKYHLPSTLLEKHPGLPKKLSPVFIDELDLVGRGTLKESLQEKLSMSNYLIVICSPNSAKSEYVNDEVSYFINNDRADHIIPFIVGGEPHAENPDEECFPKAILNLSREQELLGIDLRKFGVRDSFIRIIAVLLKLNIDDFVARDAKERKRKRIIFAAVFAVTAIAVMIAVRMLMPPPYDDVYAEYVFENSLVAYVHAGGQYEWMSKLTDCVINEPEKFSETLDLYRRRTQTETMSMADAVLYLSDMTETGEVISWSGEPMHKEECADLLQLSKSRQTEYELFVSVLEFVMSDDYARKYYGLEYPKLLREILEIDADIAAELYQIVCSPHLTGRYADGSTYAKSFASAFSAVPRQNAHLTGEDVKHSKESLARFRGARKQCLSKIDSSGAVEAYRFKVKPAISSPVVSDEVQAEIQTETESEDVSERRLLNDLLEYIYRCEIIHADILWVLDYFDRFDREKSWDNLMLAHAALSIAKRNIAAQKFHAENVFADRRSFMKRGIIPAFFEDLDFKFKAKQDTLMNSCANLINDIMYHVYLRDEWEDCKRNFEHRRRFIEYELKTLADMADLMLANIKKPDVTEKFSSILEEYCPMTYTYHRKEFDTLEKMEAELHENIEKYGEAAYEMSQIVGAEKNRLNMTLFLRDKGSMDTHIAENLADISNIPIVIPVPKGFSFTDSDIYYAWRKKDDKSFQDIPRARTKLEKVPDVCYITRNGMTSEDMREYHTLLKSIGLKSQGSSEEDGKLSFIYRTGGSTFMLSWEKGTFTIYMSEKPVCLVPATYVLEMMKRRKHVQ